jgi:hypothetical protein
MDVERSFERPALGIPIPPRSRSFAGRLVLPGRRPVFNRPVQRLFQRGGYVDQFDFFLAVSAL